MFGFRKLLVLFMWALCAFLVRPAGATLEFAWYAQGDPMLFDSSGTALPGATGPGAEDTGAYIQLIWDAFADGPEFVPGLSVEGVVGDYVLDTAYVGQGITSADRDGRFLGLLDLDATYPRDVGDEFYIRIFDSPSPDFGAGAIPTSGFYTDVTGFVLTQDHIDNEFGAFIITSPVQTTTPVPEPASLWLFLSGATLVLGLRRRV